MGWSRRALATTVMLATLTLGAWPIALLAFLYLVFSFRRPKRSQVYLLKQGDPLAERGRPMWRYCLGGLLLLVSLLALESGGAVSPVIFFLGAMVVFLWPLVVKVGFIRRVVPVQNSVLLRSLAFPFVWHALVEVKLESQDQTRGVASLSGKLLLFAGKSPSVYQVVSTYALGYRQAEDSVVKMLRRESRMLSQRGAHLLPSDSAEAAVRLSANLGRLKIGTDDFEAVSSLPFDTIAFRVQDGRLVSHRAFNVLEPNGGASIPAPDLTHVRQPLFAEVVQEIGEKHGWPVPDEFSSFLASLDATRNEPLADRFQMKGSSGGKLVVETPGGAQVCLTRPQLRVLARIYG